MNTSVSFLPKKRPAATKLKLIEAGVRLFTRQAGKGLTIRELAKEAQVNHALISYHFGGLAGLMSEVLERCMQDLRARFVPQLTAYEARLEAAENADMAALLTAHVTALFDILAGPDGRVLIKAFSNPDTASLTGVYARFSEHILEPLHHSFAFTAARVRGIDKHSLEAAVLGQCMTAQCMAFFRGAPAVRAYLGSDFSPDDEASIPRLVAESLCRTAGVQT